METERVVNSRRHDGHAIKRLRLEQDVAQDALASQIKLSEKEVVRLEATHIVDDNLLKKIAKALNVTIETIKEMKDEMPSAYIENNTFENNTFEGYSKAVENGGIHNYDPLEEVIQISDKKSRLYEQLLELERVKNKSLTLRVDELERLLKEKDNG